MMTVCEIKIGDAWAEFDIPGARSLYGKRMRCKHCWGEVHIYPHEGNAASASHFGHNSANPGCPNIEHPSPLT